MSVALPAGYGTIIVTGRLGQASAALADVVKAPSNAHNHRKYRIRQPSASRLEGLSMRWSNHYRRNVWQPTH